VVTYVTPLIPLDMPAPDFINADVHPDRSPRAVDDDPVDLSHPFRLNSSSWRSSILSIRSTAFSSNTKRFSEST
jgi:hypothetical protein